jgi:hypothetical protein
MRALWSYELKLQRASCPAASVVMSKKTVASVHGWDHTSLATRAGLITAFRRGGMMSVDLQAPDLLSWKDTLKLIGLRALAGAASARPAPSISMWKRWCPEIAKTRRADGSGRG